ncbi:ABC transporter permease [Spirosoma endbachense]|nr:ABC transporter permease [Spirosoma endbachense]
MGRLTKGDGPPECQPPPWAVWLLSHYSPDGLEDELQGDLLEMYSYWLKTVGVSKARWRYTLAVLRLIQPFTSSKIGQKSPNTHPEYGTSSSLVQAAMLPTYLKIASRKLIRHKLYSFINVVGLAVGVCACLVIYLINRYEFSFDNFHPDLDRIYCVDAVVFGGRWHSVPGPMPAAMRQEMTGIQTVAAYQTYGASVTIPPDQAQKPKHFDDDGSIVIAEPQYFDIFHYQWVSGNARTALSRPNSVVLTTERARKYFGDSHPDSIIGRTIYYQDSLMVTVTGIVADWQGNSDFRFSQWISYATIPASFLKTDITLDRWDKLNRSSQVIIKLATNVTPAQIDAQFIPFAKRHYGPKSGFTAQIKPLSGSHFYPDYGGEGRKASLPVLYSLMAVAGFILVLAIVNFVNLSTAQSRQRAKEIGVRKVLGGNRSGIAVQFFTESLLLTVAAVVLAALLVRPVMNVFADLIPAGVSLQVDRTTIVFFLLVTAVTTLLAGFYPARVLGRYQPVMTLKGITTTAGTGKATLRRGLIVFQFTISLVFIIASLVMGSQLRYVLHTNLGFKTDAIITLGGQPTNPMHTTTIGSDKSKGRLPARAELGKLAVLAEKIRQVAGVEQVIRQWKSPMDKKHSGFGGGGLKNSPEKPIDLSFHFGNQDYVPFYGMKLVAGRNLLPADSGREVLISERCAHALGFADVSQAIGQELVASPVEVYPIAGVVADFYENSFHQASWPIVIRHDPAKENVIAVKIAAKGMAAEELQTLIDKLGADWKGVFPEKPFTYSFLDDRIATMYADDLRTERLTNLAMGITIFISCLGLLGLAIFSTERRAREIGIRKVLGASVAGIVVLLCQEIVFLILIALLLASPLAWYLMHGWLQGFAYRTPLSGWLFVAAGLAAIGLALLTVGFQSVKAALMNPVKSLRSD